MSTPLYGTGPAGNAPNPTYLRGGEDAVIPADVQAGPDLLGIDAQSTLAQLGTRVALNKQQLDPGERPAQAGAFTGVIGGFYVPPGVYSQMAARQSAMAVSVVNAVQRARQLEEKQASLAASERFFWATLEFGLNREEEHTMTLAKAPTAEFAKALALATGGVLSSRDLVEGVNDGVLGYTSSHSYAQNQRLDTTALIRRTNRS
jgi:hypothetical protein